MPAPADAGASGDTDTRASNLVGDRRLRIGHPAERRGFARRAEWCKGDSQRLAALRTRTAASVRDDTKLQFLTFRPLCPPRHEICLVQIRNRGDGRSKRPDEIVVRRRRLIRLRGGHTDLTHEGPADDLIHDPEWDSDRNVPSFDVVPIDQEPRVVAVARPEGRCAR